GVSRIVREPCAALVAQPGAVRATQRGERHARHHRVENWLLQIDGLAVELEDAVLTLVLAELGARVEEEALEADVHRLVDGVEAAAALAESLRAEGSGDPDPVRAHLEARRELRSGPFLDPDHAGAKDRRDRERAGDLALRAGLAHDVPNGHVVQRGLGAG